MAWLCGVTLQLLPQMADVNPKIVVLLRVGRSPHIAKYLLVRNHPTNVRNQKREQAVFNGCEMNFSPSASHNSLRPIDFNIAKPENHVSLCAAIVLPFRRCRSGST